MTECRVQWLGRVSYLEAWTHQKQLAEARGRDAIPDTLLLLEHPHVYTLGSSGHEDNLLWDAATRQQNGVEVYRVDRGGDVTYHGPGQLVGYPILKLPRTQDGLHTDVIGYVRSIEQVLIQALSGFGIVGFPSSGLTGVWVDNPLAKIAAIGVKVTTRAVTMHGFALNVNTDMRYFTGIVPCGIADKPVTSMAERLGRAINMEAVIDGVAASFGEVMSRDLISEF